MADAMGTEDPAKAEADALEAQTRRIVRGKILVDQEGALNGDVPLPAKKPDHAKQ